MVGNDLPAGNLQSISARFFLWTIRRQDRITRWVSMNMWAAISAVLAISMIGFVAVETALQIILFGGMAAVFFIWILIERRRSWLLRISDPKLKAVAHQAMVDYLAKKLRSGSQCPGQPNGSNACPMF